MKKSILTIGLFSLVMVLTSFTTPETTTTKLTADNNGAVEINGAQSAGGNRKVDINGAQSAGGNRKVD
jgi:hypothetical protein